jgi:pyruvate ferredoxin oxidoreductase delta subunit
MAVHKKIGGFLCASDIQKGWKELPEGGIITEPGSASDYYTGGWRTYRPVVDKKRCINCLTCWMTCPDMSIVVEDDKMGGYDYDHCKGCGICAEVCPVKCIKLIQEDKFEAENKNKDYDERGRTTTVEINGKKVAAAGDKK